MHGQEALIWQGLLNRKLQNSEVQLNPHFCLFDAVHANCSQAVETILEDFKINPDVGDAKGQRPMHFAAKFGCPEIIQILVRNGASVNCANIDGK